ncbi:sigma-54-dependent Fis family transcriptional regulator [Geobacter sp. FeAm09]|uniref:sigma-54-dependent transcriptional regulator n=1 Tax=Geobacter sp. FeAm09 TaxID=2597769 RepID=UPI0011F092AF|nr:sigma-54 dependent transcriptional regulator [Geobacter sp. FeAm09]QEM67277.1 sigma-54-dependent Fis family transcriptional regulator [Geobacter sp. FeAm09]
MSNVLIIDNDDGTGSSLCRAVTGLGHDASWRKSLREGVPLAVSRPFDVVFLDIHLPDGNGLDLLPVIQAAPSSPEIIIMTGADEPDAAETVIRSGAWDYVTKGAPPEEIRLPLVRAIQYRQEKLFCSRKNVTALKRDGIVGSSRKLTACLDLVAQAAVNDTTVMITGETGTGKELFARAIHHNSGRAGGNFVVVDCAALPDTLVESLLFGHEKGAFTGAEHGRDGLIRQAHGGTLFLDEVGELSVSVQRAFLRVLQEHRFRPLGGSGEVESDFRLVSATNRDLDALVQGGQFRSDLLFRLRSFTIEIPPLRDRLDDVKELVRYHMDRLCERYGLAHKGFAPEFLQSLGAYAWPGNVRELINTLDRVIASARYEPTLFPKHLPSDIRIQAARAAGGHVRQGDASPAPVRGLPPLHDFRDEAAHRAENNYLHELIAITGGNITEACRISGLSPSRLYALMKNHHIHRRYFDPDAETE